jgi:hypothetical protein
MAFQSGVAAVDSTPHLALTWLVAVVLVACILLFLGMLSVEVWRSVQFARRVQAVRRASTASSPVGRASRPSRQFTDNPLNARRPFAPTGLGAAATARGATADPALLPPEEALTDAPAVARALTLTRPPPPPPTMRDGGPVGGLHTAVGSSAASAMAAVEPRSRHATRGPQAPAGTPESLESDRDGRVRRLRNVTSGRPPPPPPPLRPYSAAATAGGVDVELRERPLEPKNEGEGQS